MKYFIIGFSVLAVLVAVWVCGSYYGSEDVEEPSDVVVLETDGGEAGDIVVEDLEPLEDVLVDEDVEEEEVEWVSPYEKWAIPYLATEDLGRFVLFESMDTDCVGVSHGELNGGDMLSSLIVNDPFRGRVELDRYSKSYVTDLEKRVSGFTNESYQSDFYAFASCNLREGVDAVSGYFWPMGEDTSEGSFSRMEHGEDEVMLIVNGEDVVRVDGDVRLYNSTATGAEVFPCKGAMVEGAAEWTCFLGLADDEYGYTFPLFGIWNISLEDGEVLDYREYYEDDNTDHEM